jgi:hypothetical protein
MFMKNTALAYSSRARIAMIAHIDIIAQIAMIAHNCQNRFNCHELTPCQARTDIYTAQLCHTCTHDRWTGRFVATRSSSAPTTTPALISADSVRALISNKTHIFVCTWACMCADAAPAAAIAAAAAAAGPVAASVGVERILVENK